MLDENSVRQRAYEIWEQDGCPEGREMTHWERALSELQAKSAQPRAMKAARKSTASTKAPKKKALKAAS